MTILAHANQGIQVALEGTLGVSPSSGYKTIRGVQFTPGIKLDALVQRATGRRAASLVINNKEWSGAGVTGSILYEEAPYLLAMMLGDPTITQYSTFNAYKQVWTPTVRGTVNPHPASIEQGESGSGNAVRYPGSFLVQYGLSVSRSGATQTGQIMGRPASLAATLTASPGDLDITPARPDSWAIYDDSAAAGLGTTIVAEPHQADLSINGFHGTWWALNRNKASWSNIVNLQPTFEFKFVVPKDATETYMGYYRNQTKRFFRFDSLYGLIAGTFPYLYRVDMAAMVKNVGDWQDVEGAFGAEVTCEVVEDATWGKFMELTTANSLATL